MSDGAIADLRSLAAATWFGYGRWSAPYWCIGMEPGGTDHPELYTSWAACGAQPLIDAKAHEDEWNLRVPVELQTHYFAEKPQIQKSTWQPLIHIILGFTGSSEDPHAYQRAKLGRADRETALIELSAIAARSISDPADREQYRSERIEKLHKELTCWKPELALFYGGYADDYSRIAGHLFDASGVCWNGPTLCALIAHPAARPTRSYAYWMEYGRRLRQIKIPIQRPAEP